jgi:diguanylate cyclase (GGDEF)-like protein/PAS domain S-box-containing protein
MLDREGRVASWNYGAERIKGWAAHEILGEHFSRFFPGDVPRSRLDDELAIAASRGHHREEGWRVRKDGSRFWANAVITAMRDEEGELLGYAKIVRDLSERKGTEDLLREEVDQRRLAEEALREMIASLETVIDERTNLLQVAVVDLSEAKRSLEDLAQHDALTGLPNRRLLLDRLRQATSAARRRSRGVGVLFVDLDRFKEINDTHGHDAGDAVLQEVARRLQACVREADTVAREGGDEFVVVLPDLEMPEDAMRVADKMLVELSRSMDVGGAEVRITPSIGISHYPRDATDMEELINRADRAMYSAKGAGRNTIRSFT